MGILQPKLMSSGVGEYFIQNFKERGVNDRSRKTRTV